MTRTARTTLWIILLLIAIGVVSGLYMSVKLHFEHLPEEKAVIPVEVITAEVRPLMEELRYTGTVLAEPSAMVSAKVAGTIREVAVSEGDRVDEGAVLAVIEDTIYAEQVSLARHQTEAARAQLIGDPQSEAVAPTLAGPIAEDSLQIRKQHLHMALRAFSCLFHLQYQLLCPHGSRRRQPLGHRQDLVKQPRYIPAGTQQSIECP